jgi:hypothetical protein
METEVRSESICPLRPCLTYWPLLTRARRAKSHDGSYTRHLSFPGQRSLRVAVTKCMGRVPASVYIIAQGGYPKTAPSSSLDTRAKIFAYLQKQDTRTVLRRKHAVTHAYKDMVFPLSRILRRRAESRSMDCTLGISARGQVTR